VCYDFLRHRGVIGGAARPEDKARETIDDLLKKAGWRVVNQDEVNIGAFQGIAFRGVKQDCIDDFKKAMDEADFCTLRKDQV